MSTFLDKVAAISQGTRVVNNITSGSLDYLPNTFNPYVKLMQLSIEMKTSVTESLEADYDVIRRSLINQIAMEVYGDVRVRLDEYINERLMDGDGRSELIAIREMME